MSTVKSLHPLQGALRIQILDLYKMANAGHIACSLSCIDLMIASYLENKKDEDVFILSKGHAALALYVCLNASGAISNDLLQSYYKNGTTLTAHPAPNQFKDVPLATGSLGHGFPFATGVAKADKIKKNRNITMVLMSDGETNEGTTWEAAHFARQHQLDNLIVIVDKNGLQGFGGTQEVLGDSATNQQWSALGFDVYETDGHDVKQNSELIAKLKMDKNKKPKVILANTIKGKGVPFMEAKLEWHYLPMNEDQYRLALTEVKNNFLV